jgi:hypothetical protein
VSIFLPNFLELETDESVKSKKAICIIIVKLGLHCQGNSLSRTVWIEEKNQLTH